MAECVKVVVRCRPMNSRELAMKCCSVVDIDSTSRECSLTVDEKSPRKRFTFDGAYDAQNNTEQIYSRVIYPLVESVLEGYNGTIFAYGQTGSGKSYSMQGVKEPACDKGVIPRAFDHIFENILASEDSKFLVHASYLEIYNEEVRDLLAKDVRKKLDLKEDFAKGIYVNGLSMHQCNNQKACEKVMQKGWSNRSVGGTLMNAESSRSHSIFTIHLERSDAVVSESENTQPNKKTSNKTKIRVAKLNLIDLAGSERQGKTGASGVRLKEATKINLSLSALGNVISALVDGKCSHVPFRDSKLTRLLQDSLGGNTKTLMLACLSPADNNADETLSTLRYANRAKSIKNKPKINEDPKDALIRQFQEEILKLKELLAKNALPQTTLPTEAASTFDRKMLSPHPCGIANEKKDNDVLNQKFQKEIENSKQELLEMKKAKRKAEERFEELNKMYQSFRDHKVVDGDGGEVETADVPAAKQKAGTVEKNEKKELSGSELKKALLRIEELESKIVRGEEKTKEQMKLKKEQRKQQFENDKKMLMEVIKHESEDDVMVEIFGNTCEKLKHMKDVADKQKSKIDTLNQDLADLKSEFEEDRADYLDTIRGCEKDNSWLEAVLAKVLPLVRKNCNYCNLDKIKHDSSWDDLEKVWSLPPLLFQEVRLPDPPPSKLSASSHPIRSFCVALSRGEENVNMQNKMTDEEKNSLKNKKNNEKTVFVGFEKLSDKKTDFPTTESFRKSSKLKPLKLPRMK